MPSPRTASNTAPRPFESDRQVLLERPGSHQGFFSQLREGLSWLLSKVARVSRRVILGTPSAPTTSAAPSRAIAIATREVLAGRFESQSSEAVTGRLTSRSVAKLIDIARREPTSLPYLRAQAARALPRFTGDGWIAALELVTGPGVYPRLPSPHEPRTAPMRAVALGRRFLGFGTNDLESTTAGTPYAYQGGPDGFECTQFVTWLLKSTGQIDRTFQNGEAFRDYALRSGSWREVPAAEMRPGDVVRLASSAVRHSVIFSRRLETGEPVFLGANYVDGWLDVQVVSEHPQRDSDRIGWVLRYTPPSTLSKGDRPALGRAKEIGDFSAGARSL